MGEDGMVVAEGMRFDCDWAEGKTRQRRERDLDQKLVASVL